MKRALVLSGGGSKGSWQAGVIMGLGQRFLNARKVQSYDAFYGISVGAINAAALSQFLWQGGEGLVEMWKTISNKDVKKHWLPFSFLSGLWKNSLFSTKPLERLLEKNFDPRLVAKPCFVGAVSLNSNEIKYFDVRDQQTAIKSILASSAFPGFLEAQQIDGEWFVDGGVRDLTPLKLAIEHGADEIDVIICSNPFAAHKSNKKKFNVFEVLVEAVDSMMAEVMINDIKIAEMYNRLLKFDPIEGKRKVKINLIYPEAGLPFEVLDFDPKNIEKMLEMGFEVGLNKELL